MCPKCEKHLFCRDHSSVVAQTCPNPACAKRITPCITPGELGGSIATLSLTVPFVVDDACHGTGLVGHTETCHNATRAAKDWTVHLEAATVLQLRPVKAESSDELAEVIALQREVS